MTTAAKLAANQHNAQLSTGPRTDAGKAVSSQNGATHGLSSSFRVLLHENQADFHALQQALESEFAPTGEHEAFLVSQMIQSRWRLHRIDRLETAAYDLILMGEDPSSSQDPDAKIIASMSKRDRDPIALLQRYRVSAERAYYKAHKELLAGRHGAIKAQQTTTELIIRQAMFGPTPGQLDRLQAAVNGFASQPTGSNAPLRL